ncbi:MAG: sulfatase-like hydrolase/transferase, partial [Bacteroidota bacterium]
TRFTNAFATSPICSPSRVGLLTGTYHQRQQVFWYGGNGLSNPQIPTIAETLQKNGYQTGMIGKFHYGSKDADTTHRSFPLNHGFQELFGFNGGRKHYLIHDSEKEAAFRQLMEKAPQPKQSFKMESFFRQAQREKAEGFATELLSEEAIQFMDKKKNAENPYFLTLSFNAVHNFTHQLPQEYLDHTGLKGMADWNPNIETYYEWYERGRKPNNPEGRAHYLGQLYYLDKAIGRIMDYLKETNQLENTIIIYVGDNGGSTQIYADNGLFAGGKYTMYDGGLRIPLLVSWQGNYQQNAVSENMVSAMDIFPTLTDATNTARPATLDGISLHELLSGNKPNIEHETLFWFGGEQAAVRSGKWKYRYANDAVNSFAKSSTKYEGVSLELGEFLHDVNTDIGESKNLKEAHPEVLADLKAQLAVWKKEVVGDVLD